MGQFRVKNEDGSNPLSLNKATLVIVFFTFFCGALPADEAGETSRQVPEFLTPAASFGFEHDFKADFRDYDSKVAVSKTWLTFSLTGINVNYTVSQFHWDNAGRAGFADAAATPWERFHTVSLGKRFFRRVSSDDKNQPATAFWMLTGGVRGGLAFERQISGSEYAGFDISLGRQINDQWSAGLGAAAIYHPVRSRIFPIVSLQYDDKQGSGLSATLGYPIKVGYRLNESAQLFFLLDMEGRYYRLKDSSSVADKGYFREKSITPEIGLIYTPVDNLVLSGAVFYHFDRQWRIYDSGGSRLERTRLDNGPGLSFSALWRF